MKKTFILLSLLVAFTVPGWSASLAYKETLGGGAATNGTTITAHASAHTKGSWTSLGTSTAASAYVSIVLEAPLQAKSYLVDIGADPAGGTTYVTFVGNIPITSINESVGVGQLVVVPVPIVFASGTQFAARCQSDTGGSTVQAHLVLYTGSTAFTVTWVETIGADTATSRGQTVDPGAVTNTKGLYTQLVATSAGAADYLVPVVLVQPTSTVSGGHPIWLDVATGAAASEVVKAGNVEYVGGWGRYFMTGALEVDIANGVRVAARMQSTNDAVGRREADVAVIAFVKSAAAGGSPCRRILP
jgi:hypothetical protein